MSAINIPLVTWCVVLAAVFVLILIRLLHKDRHSHRHVHLHHRVLEIGSEREEFYLPGDVVSNKDESINEPD